MRRLKASRTTAPAALRPVPRRVKVFGSTQRIDLAPFEQAPLNGACLGINDLDTAHITLREDLPHDRMAEVLFHELAHTVEHHFQLQMTEEVIDAFALGFLDIVRSNPGLIAWARQRDK